MRRAACALLLACAACPGTRVPAPTPAPSANVAPPTVALTASFDPSFALRLDVGGAPWNGLVQIEWGSGHDAHDGVEAVDRPKFLMHDDFTAHDGVVAIPMSEVRKIAGPGPFTIWMAGRPHPELGETLADALRCADGIRPLYEIDACLQPIPSGEPPSACGADGARAWSNMRDRAIAKSDACWPPNDPSTLARLRSTSGMHSDVRKRVCDALLDTLGDPPYRRDAAPVLEVCGASSNRGERKVRQAQGWLDLVKALADAKARGGATRAAVDKLALGGELACVLRARTPALLSCWKGGVAKTLPVDDAIDVAVTEKSVCVLHASGVVSCWEDAEIPRVVPKIGENAIAISGNERMLCALRKSGAASCLYGDTMHEIKALGDAESLVVSMQHACAVRRTRSVACWGSMPPDRPYDPKADEFAARDVPGLAQIAALGLGGWHTCALGRAGRVSCLGENFSGQIGDDTTNTTRKPVTVPNVAGATAIGGGYIYTCVARRAGTTLCWGVPSNAQVDGAPRSSVATAIAGADDLVEVAVGDGQACGLRASGDVVCWALPAGSGAAKKIDLP